MLQCANIPARNYTPTVDRFWAGVDKSDTGCWNWAKSKTKAGYGTLRSYDNVLLYAHRFSWELHHGPIPPKLYVCHHCDNPGCVRPDHLFVGTHNDNMQDMLKKGRGSANRNKAKTHCPQ